MISKDPVERPLPVADGKDKASPTRSEADEKGIADATTYPSDDSESIRDFPWTWKATALFCGVALSWGSSFSENTLGPLKSTLIKNLDINNSQVRFGNHSFPEKDLY